MIVLHLINSTKTLYYIWCLRCKIWPRMSMAQLDAGFNPENPRHSQMHDKTQKTHNIVINRIRPKNPWPSNSTTFDVGQTYKVYCLVCYIAGFRSFLICDFIKKKHTCGWRRVAFDWMLAWRLLPRQWIKCVFAQEAPCRASGRECKKFIQFNKIPFISQS